MKTYNPKEVTVIINAHNVTGFAEGEFINYVREVPSFTHNTDLHGNTTRAKSGNDTGILTLTLSQASNSNDILSNYYNVDKLQATGLFAISMRDARGTTLVSSLGAWAEDITPITFADTVGTRTWRIILSNAGDYAGGLN